MKPITYIDLEVDPDSKTIRDIGAIRTDGAKFHQNDLAALSSFLKETSFLCGHNIWKHDLVYLKKTLQQIGFNTENVLDTLLLSPLIFPTRSTFKLLKDDKLLSDDLNNPLSDSIKAQQLLDEQIASFLQMESRFQQMLYFLLKDQQHFSAFFRYLEFPQKQWDCNDNPLEATGILIRQLFKNKICQHSHIERLIKNSPIALAYCLALIYANEQYVTIPRWVLANFAEVEDILFQLRSKPCHRHCPYCAVQLDIHKGLKKHFGFDEYRLYGEEPLQQKAVAAAIENQSLIAVFPTGGGKSVTFQVPALMQGESTKGLTVVISPLQSLMKDQIDNLEKAAITEAVAINGLLDPIERAKSLERVEDGSATLLYISPESLRSKTIERLLLGRNIVRFVIDEAHCFSAWGQNFRVDYLYIGPFIRSLQKKKHRTASIPVSCFTATAKQEVILDIQHYFKAKLGLELALFSTKVTRTNLHYKVFLKETEEDKYQFVKNLLEAYSCPTIIYVSRTKKAFQLAEQLSKIGYNAKPYHGKMDVQEKTTNQNDFIEGKVDIIVATSAFGMGVDKKDVRMVIHYDISDSLENYVQEAGRAGRDEQIQANCFVLYNEEDIGHHLNLLNQTKLSIKEIQQVWKAVKEITRLRATVSNSALEIARKAGWDDHVQDLETRVLTAIAALENAGYLQRRQNQGRVFASSILVKNAQEAIDKINASDSFDNDQRQKAIQIIKKLISSKSRQQTGDEIPESRIDYISDHLGIRKQEVIHLINLLRETHILADTKDLTAFIKKQENKNQSLLIVQAHAKIELFLQSIIDQQEQSFQLKELNAAALSQGVTEATQQKIKTVLNFWAITHWIKRKKGARQQLHLIGLYTKEQISTMLEKRHALAKFIISFLFNKIQQPAADEQPERQPQQLLIEFSVLELKSAYDAQMALHKQTIDIKDIEDTLFYLSRIEAIKIEGGFLVLYNQLTIQRTEQDNKKRYTKDDYNTLETFYDNKVQQIHIVGEYAKKMMADYSSALQFTEDYFQLNYPAFLTKYFPGNTAKDLQLKITTSKFKQLFGELSPTQLKIIQDNEAKRIVVTAGPGSGKTRVLVHKLAALLLMEDVRPEQLLMLTFSRAAATEFKIRLLQLIGKSAHYVTIKTFHSFCFDLLGKVGSLENAGTAIKEAVDMIDKKGVELSLITKTVLVIDEAQDMNEEESNLIETLIAQNEEMRLLAVGDDDQNIFGFRRATAKFMTDLIQQKGATQYELIENYRSRQNLVAFTNQFITGIKNRLKSIPITAHQQQKGTLRLIHCDAQRLSIPLVQQIIRMQPAGTICALTKTNHMALQVTGLLHQQGIPASLIQTDSTFNLLDLVEFRYFIDQMQLPEQVFLIAHNIWEKAKKDTIIKFRKSKNLQLLLNAVSLFEAAYPDKRYKAELESYIAQSSLEDYTSTTQGKIYVSTIHKAKGKEFDHVFLMLEDIMIDSDDTKRLLYVAMTRAKQGLTVVFNQPVFDEIHVAGLEYLQDSTPYPTPPILTITLTHRDIWLDYFKDKQSLIDQIPSGTPLNFHSEGALSYNGQFVLKLSQNFMQQIKRLEAKGYTPKTAAVNYIVHWTKNASKLQPNEAIKIILPTLHFEKVNNAAV